MLHGLARTRQHLLLFRLPKTNGFFENNIFLEITSRWSPNTTRIEHQCFTVIFIFVTYLWNTFWLYIYTISNDPLLSWYNYLLIMRARISMIPHWNIFTLIWAAIKFGKRWTSFCFWWKSLLYRYFAFHHYQCFLRSLIMTESKYLTNKDFHQK